MSRRGRRGRLEHFRHSGARSPLASTSPEPSSAAVHPRLTSSSNSLGQLGVRTATSGRLQQQYRIDPDLVRALPDGEAVVAHAGRWAHVKVALPDEASDR
jgi:hypothetical protein